MIPSHAIFSFYFILPLLLSSLVMRPRAIWVTLIVTLLITTLVAYATPGAPLLAGPLPIFWPLVFLEFLVTVIGFLTGRATVGALTEALRARLSAEHAASQLERANADLESHVALRTRELQAALGEVEDRANEQERLLKENEQQRQIIRELSVPVLPITDDTLVMPLIGALDSARLMDIQQTALEAIERNAARRLLLDITGVPVVDSQVAQGLMSVVQAAWLLGAEIMLVGIRPEVAQAIVGLGLALERVRTFSDLRSALLASAQVSGRAAPARPDASAARASAY
jgi:rsbT co-antagonist protein RsbR